MVVIASSVVGVFALRCAGGCKICCIVCRIDKVILVIVADKHAQVAQIHIAVLHRNGDVAIITISIAQGCGVSTVCQSRMVKVPS